MRPYRPRASAKMRMRIMPTKSFSCCPMAFTPASPTIPIAMPAASPLFSSTIRARKGNAEGQHGGGRRGREAADVNDAERKIGPNTNPPLVVTLFAGRPIYCEENNDCRQEHGSAQADQAEEKVNRPEHFGAPSLHRWRRQNCCIKKHDSACPIGGGTDLIVTTPSPPRFPTTVVLNNCRVILVPINWRVILLISSPPRFPTIQNTH